MRDAGMALGVGVGGGLGRGVRLDGAGGRAGRGYGYHGNGCVGLISGLPAGEGSEARLGKR